MRRQRKVVITGLAFCGLVVAGLATGQQRLGPLTFFLTSDGSGNGADLGGLEGADAICQNLGGSVGEGERIWRAYLSTQGDDAINARDRIGTGPWFNANGNQIAANLDELHSVQNRVSAFTAVDQRGRKIPGSGFTPNRHDILTGSQVDGTAYPDGEDMTCKNWTSSSDDGKAKVGHHDYAAWNSAHNSRGCTQAALNSSGGDGLFYCFAADE